MKNEVPEATVSHINDIRNLQRKIWSIVDDGLWYHQTALGQAWSENSWGCGFMSLFLISRYHSRLNSPLKVSPRLTTREYRHCWLEHWTRKRPMSDLLLKLVSRYLGYTVPLKSGDISMLSVSIHGIKIARQVLKKSTPQLTTSELHQSAAAFGLVIPAGRGPGRAGRAACWYAVLFPGPGWYLCVGLYQAKHISLVQERHSESTDAPCVEPWGVSGLDRQWIQGLYWGNCWGQWDWGCSPIPHFLVTQLLLE